MFTPRTAILLTFTAFALLAVSDVVMLMRLSSIERMAAETREEQLDVREELLAVNKALDAAVIENQNRRDVNHREIRECLDRIEQLLLDGAKQ